MIFLCVGCWPVFKRWAMGGGRWWDCGSPCRFQVSFPLLLTWLFDWIEEKKKIRTFGGRRGLTDLLSATLLSPAEHHTECLNSDYNWKAGFSCWAGSCGYGPLSDMDVSVHLVVMWYEFLCSDSWQTGTHHHDLFQHLDKDYTSSTVVKSNQRAYLSKSLLYVSDASTSE